MPDRADKDAVRAALTIQELLASYGFEPLTEKADRYNDCPACGAGCRGKFKVTEEVCLCHACGFKGDIFTIAGAILDLDPEAHFRKIVDECASLAGVAGDYDQAAIDEIRAARKTRQALVSSKRAKDRERAEKGARDVWGKLRLRSVKGQEYVANRGVMPTRAASDCRFTDRSVCLPLWRDGQIVNVVGRRFDNGNPKIRGLARCGTLGTFGEAKIRKSHQGPVVIVEGFFDYLSAKQLSPTRLVLGAHGCSNLPYVAEVAAKLIEGTAHGIVLVPHQDSAGAEWMGKARASLILGAVADRVITEFKVAEGCNDLNDHLCSYSAGAMP